MSSGGWGWGPFGGGGDPPPIGLASIAVSMSLAPGQIHIPSMGQTFQLTRTIDFFKRVKVERPERDWKLEEYKLLPRNGGEELQITGISAEPYPGYLPPDDPNRVPLDLAVRVTVNDRIVIDQPLQTLVDDWVSVGRMAQALGLDRLERELKTLRDHLSEIGEEQMERGLQAIEAAQMAMVESRNRTKPLVLKQPYFAEDDFDVRVVRGGEALPFNVFYILVTGTKKIPIGR